MEIQRMCICCRAVKNQQALWRLAIFAQPHLAKPEKLRQVQVDFTYRQGGRGAYICKDPACLVALLKKRHLQHFLKCAIDPHSYEVIAEEIRRQTEFGVDTK